jgi:tRNA(Ile)-lysidine synthase TilS/MesJ
MKQEKCHKCSKDAGYKHVDKWYCTRCFTDICEQKIKHNLRRYSIKKDRRIMIGDKACEYVFRKVINLPVKIVKAKGDYKVVPWTLDDENEMFLKRYFKSKPQKEDKSIIKLFCPLSKDDVKQYCEIKKIGYNPEKTEINLILDKIDSKYPGTKTSLLKSEEKLSR